MPASQRERTRRAVPEAEVIADLVDAIDRMPEGCAELVGEDLGHLLAVSKAHPELAVPLFSLWRACTVERRRGNRSSLLVIAKRWIARAESFSSTERAAVQVALHRAERVRRTNARTQRERDAEDRVYEAAGWF